MEKRRTGSKAGGQTEHKREDRLTTGYIIIPAEIEAIPERVLSSKGKRWYGHVFGYGTGGCFESESKHGRMYEVTDRTVMRWSRVMERLGEILRLNLKGQWGCVWALRHPEVQKMEFLEHEGVKVRNPAYNRAKGTKRPPTWVSGDPRHRSQGTPDMGRYIPPTWMSDNYYTNKKSTSAGSPSPELKRANRLKEETKRAVDLDIAIRSELWRRLPPVKPGDWDEHKRRVDVLMQVSPKVKEGTKAGLSVAEAMDRVFNENAELINGGEQK